MLKSITNLEKRSPYSVNFLQWDLHLLHSLHYSASSINGYKLVSHESNSRLCTPPPFHEGFVLFELEGVWVRYVFESSDASQFRGVAPYQLEPQRDGVIAADDR